ncbi:MAG: SHOCT domain-containing protein [Thermoplasmata archaeon]
MISSLIASAAPIILNGNDTHHPMEDWSMMGGAWWIWLILVIAVILVIGVLIALLLNGSSNGSNRSSTNKSAEQILDERYARGEITEEEYREKKKEMRR